MKMYRYSIFHFAYNKAEKTFHAYEEMLYPTNDDRCAIPFPNKGKKFYIENSRTGNWREYKLKSETPSEYIFENDDTETFCIIKKLIKVDL
jgi:hypothetical protein